MENNIFNISTKITKLNLKVILDNYKKPEFWKKEWTIYKHNNIEITWHLYSINCKENTISSIVNIRGFVVRKGGKHFVDIGHGFWETSSTSAYCSNIPIDNSDYKQEVFENNIIGACLKVLFQAEQNISRQYAEYRSAKSNDDDYNDALAEIAEAFLDRNNVTNKEIRDAYIDSYVSKNTSSRFAYMYLKECEYKIIPNEYILLLSYFNNKKIFDEYKQKVGGHRKKFWFDIWKRGREMDTDEWREEMEAELEDL